MPLPNLSFSLSNLKRKLVRAALVTSAVLCSGGLVWGQKGPEGPVAKAQELLRGGAELAVHEELPASGECATVSIDNEFEEVHHWHVA